MTTKDALSKFRREVLGQGSAIDPDNERDWHDLAYGYFLALGFDKETAWEMAIHAEDEP